MNKFKFLAFILLAAMTLGFSACGSDDEPEKPKQAAPVVVSTSPENGSTTVEPGAISVTITYDKTITMTAGDISKIQATGATISNVRTMSAALMLTATCAAEGQAVTITIPAGVIKNTDGEAAAAYSLSFTTKKTELPDPVAPDGHESAAQAVLNMTPGWNLGNTLESYGDWIGNHQEPYRYETAWGQPITDAHLMQAFKEKGFKGIRVPVTWYQHMDDQGNVDEAWMNRVQEVVDYVINQGMYCILNVHHDTGAHNAAWVVASPTLQLDRYAKLWTQIATRFKNYDHHLLFEGYNEMLNTAQQWNQPSNLSDLVYVNQHAAKFVEAVRATGGNNTYRNLVVSTYAAAHGTAVLNGLTIPTDPCGNQSHIAVEVHSYDPWDWLHVYNMTWTSECREVLKSMFRDLETYFISKGYPVIIGEYATNGAGEITIDKNSTTAQKAEAGKQAGDMNRLCKKYGAASFYWMLLVDGADRSEATFRWSMEQVADSIVNVYK